MFPASGFSASKSSSYPPIELALPKAGSTVSKEETLGLRCLSLLDLAHLPEGTRYCLPRQTAEFRRLSPVRSGHSVLQDKQKPKSPKFKILAGFLHNASLAKENMSVNTAHRLPVCHLWPFRRYPDFLAGMQANSPSVGQPAWASQDGLSGFCGSMPH